MKKYFLILTSMAVFAMIPVACKKSNNSNDAATSCDTSPTYTADVKKIIDASCAISGCHAANSANGVFTTYAGLKPYLTSGDFKREVITNKSMPQGSSLTTADYSKINCWVLNNYAE